MIDDAAHALSIVKRRFASDISPFGDSRAGLKRSQIGQKFRSRLACGLVKTSTGLTGRIPFLNSCMNQ